MTIPKPLPFMRLGLANLPIMAGLALLTTKETILLIFLKILLQAFVSGTLFSYVFLFSLAGTVASGFGMMLVYKLLGGKSAGSEAGSSSVRGGGITETEQAITKGNDLLDKSHAVTKGGAWVSWFGVSMFGGLMNNLAQIVMARFIMFGDNIAYVAPVLLAVGFVSSGLLGVFMNLFWKNSRFVQIVMAGLPSGGSFTCVQDDRGGVQDGRGCVIPSGCEESHSWKVYACFILSLCAFVLLLYSASLYVVYGIFALFILLNLIKYKKVRLLSPIIIILSITLLELLSPAGKILWQYGAFKITTIPLVAGLLKSGKLCAMVVVSKFAVSRDLKLPGRVGEFVAQVFGIFGQLNEKQTEDDELQSAGKKGKTWKKVISSIDRRLCEVWQQVSA